MSDNYNVTKFLNLKMERPFDEFKKAIKVENARYEGSFTHRKFKDKEEESYAAAYWRILDNIVAFLDVDMKYIPFNCDIKDLKVFIPVLDKYVSTGEVDSTVLRVLRQER